MTKAVFFFSFCLVFSCSYGQVTDPMRNVDSINKKMDSIFRPNKAYDNPTTLDGCLRRDFPEKSSTDGRWVYYPEQGKIERIIKPEVSKIIPDYSFYRVVMTNYLGYHINRSGCLILYDSARQRTELIEPIWYSDNNEFFLKFFIGRKFSDSTSLLQFVHELQDLMIIGTSGAFINTKYQAGKVSFDLTFDHASASTGIVNAVYGIWRNFEIGLQDNAITKFIITNPRMNESSVVQ